MSDTQTALLVIDVQQSFEQRAYWTDEHVADWRQKQSQMIEHARQQSWPVVFVYHLESEGVFSRESGWVKPMDFVDRQPDDPAFDKTVHNALTDSGLLEWLEREQIKRVIISGIRTEQCCETTARVASDLGFDVEFVLDATLTFDMQNPTTGDSVSMDAIRQHTAMVLSDRFARITATDEYTR